MSTYSHLNPRVGHGWDSTQGRCISANTRRCKARAGKLRHRRPPQGLGLEPHCAALQRDLDGVHQLICSSNGEELPKNLLVLTMAIGRVLREEAGPSDLCCGVLFLVLSHLMASSSRSARRIVHHSLLEVKSPSCLKYESISVIRYRLFASHPRDG
jgi:hypothetical protein